MYNLEYLEGRKFCIVFVKVLDQATGRVQCRCLRGRATLAASHGHLTVITEGGAKFDVPATALPTIQPSDGTALLRDAEYFCLVKVSDNIELAHEHHSHDGCGCGSHAHHEEEEDSDILPVVF